MNQDCDYGNGWVWIEGCRAWLNTSRGTAILRRKGNAYECHVNAYVDDRGELHASHFLTKSTLLSAINVLDAVVRLSPR